MHEAYLRLVDGDTAQHWDSRGHFFAAAAEAMRRILVDNARTKQSLSPAAGRPSGCRLEASGTVRRSRPTRICWRSTKRSFDWNSWTQTKAELVKLRYFAGLTIPQAAKALGISTTTANRYWAYARAWLHEELKSDE